MEVLSASTTLGNNTLDGFGHHGYGVTTANLRLDTTTLNSVHSTVYSVDSNVNSEQCKQHCTLSTAL